MLYFDQAVALLPPIAIGTASDPMFSPLSAQSADAIALDGFGQVGAQPDWLPNLPPAHSPIDLPAAIPASAERLPLGEFSEFWLRDASGDNTPNTAFAGGALRLSYQVAGGAELLGSVQLEAWQAESWVATLGNWTAASLTNELIDLGATELKGICQFRLVATQVGVVSAPHELQILSWDQPLSGTFAANSFNADPAAIASVFLGRGGTDTLNLLGITQSSVTSLNNLKLADVTALNSTINQAIFQGTAFDYLTFANGHEIYFQGIEQLRFSDGSTIVLQVQPNDPDFAAQWNLHITDVDSAWRFTQGSTQILLASLDTGITLSPLAGADLSSDRLIAGASADDDFTDGSSGHGQLAISIMAATANNGSGIAGINWQSSIYVNDIYSGGNWVWRDGQWVRPNGVTLPEALQTVIDYARAQGQRVVFQAGIQGESWLTRNLGDREQLEQILRDSADIAIFAVAAGNGGIDIDLTDPEFVSVRQNLSAGFARFQTNYGNVIAVGALRCVTSELASGLVNATTVDLASYSNFGPSLTLVAPTDAPGVDQFNYTRSFGGTSGANPNMAGIASLVWSVNPDLTGEQLRQVLIDTAIDLGPPGPDDRFGRGLVNADAAVRRAWALGRDRDLASLYASSRLLV